MWPRNVGVGGLKSSLTLSGNANTTTTGSSSKSSHASKQERPRREVRATREGRQKQTSIRKAGAAATRSVTTKVYRHAPPPERNPWGIEQPKPVPFARAAASLDHNPVDGNKKQRTPSKNASASRNGKPRRADARKGKPAPTSLDEVNLFAFIKKAPRGQGGIKKRAQSKKSTTKGTERAKALNALDSAADRIVRRGKTRDPKFGKKKKVSSLKKVILRERTERFHLAHPEAARVPLVVHGSCYGINITKREVECQPSALVESPVFWGYAAASAPAKEPPAEASTAVQKSTHARKRVRNYVNQALSKALDEHVIQLLKTLVYYQNRALQSKSTKKRRIKMGLREVYRGVRSRKVKCVIVAPNIEQSYRQGGIDDKISSILEGCKATIDQDGMPVDAVPVVFALNRKKIARAVGKRQVGVSVVGVYDADGAYEHFRPMLKLAEKLRAHFQQQVSSAGPSTSVRACSTCDAALLSERYDCLKCGAVRCLKCCSSMLARRIPCTLSTSGDGATCDYAIVPCNVKKGKSLSVDAPAFVPSFSIPSSCNSGSGNDKDENSPISGDALS